MKQYVSASRSIAEGGSRVGQCCCATFSGLTSFKFGRLMIVGQGTTVFALDASGIV